MDISKKIVFLLHLIPILTYSQTKLLPILGVAFLGNQIVEGKNEYVDARKYSRSDLDEGFSIIHGLKNNYQLDYGLLIGSIGRGYEIRDGNGDSFNRTYEYTWHDLYQISIHLGKESKTFNFIKYKNQDRPFNDDGYIKIPQKYYLSFTVVPFLGLSYNLVNKGGNAYNMIDGYSVNKSEDIEVKTYIGDNNDYILKDRGVSIQSGTRIQFKRKNKDVFSLQFLLNISLQKYFENNIEYKFTNSSTWMTAKFISRGHYAGIYLSYPITLVNKKGERYRDRHPR